MGRKVRFCEGGAVQQHQMLLRDQVDEEYKVFIGLGHIEHTVHLGNWHDGGEVRVLKYKCNLE